MYNPNPLSFEEERLQGKLDRRADLDMNAKKTVNNVQERVVTTVSGSSSEQGKDTVIDLGQKTRRASLEKIQEKSRILKDQYDARNEMKTAPDVDSATQPNTEVKDNTCPVEYPKSENLVAGGGNYNPSMSDKPTEKTQDAGEKKSSKSTVKVSESKNSDVKTAKVEVNGSINTIR